MRAELKYGAVALLASLVGGAAVWFGQTSRFSLRPVGMSYADLAALLLTAVGVIVAIFGGVLALAAIWGFNQLKSDAIKAASDAGAAEAKEQIENGTTRAYMLAEIRSLADQEFKSERMTQRINERVDAVAFGRPDEDDLLNDEEGQP